MATSPEQALDILVVEDGEVNQKLAVGLIERHGHQATVAVNGQEALNVLSDRDFDVVFMDVQMPILDGLDTTRAIREREQGTEEHIPIIAMTAHAMVGDRDRCLEAGMDDYLTKPIRSNAVFEALQRLGLFQPGEMTAPAPQPQAAAGPLIGEVDWRVALETVNGSEALLLDIINEFLSEVPKLMSRISQAIADNDAENGRLAAHTLKSALRIFAAHRTSNFAMQIEKSAESENLVDAAELLPELERGVESIQQELRKRLEDS